MGISSRVAKLSRAQLEALVLESLKSGEAIEPTSLTPPEKTRVVSIGAALEGASVGCFARLGDDILEELVTTLSGVTRLTFTRRVCKSLRALEIPWTTMVLEERCEYRKRPENSLWVLPGADFARIQTFVRASASALVTLTLDFRQADNAGIVKLIRAAPRLSDLTLSGKKMTSSVIKPLLAGIALGPVPLTRTLRRFTFGPSSGTSETALKLVGAATKLEHLGVHNSLPIEALTGLVAAWRKARGEPLLESLDLGTQQTNDLPYFRLDVLLPGLRELKLCMWYDKIGQGLNLPAGLTSIDLEMIGTDTKSDDRWTNGKRYSSANTTKLFSTILDACPNATTVSMGWCLSRRETERIATMLPLNALSHASVTDLTLVGVKFSEDTLLNLPSLSALTFRQCVVKAPKACHALRLRGIAVRTAPSRHAGYD